jgi:Tol biopolymer transport system component
VRSDPSGAIGPESITPPIAPRRRRVALPASALALMLLLPCAACTDRPVGVSGDPSRGLVFARVANGSLDLARARLFDAAVRAFAESADDESWPYWSEPARRVVFQRAPTAGGQADLWLWDPVEDDAEQLTDTPNRDERWPAWSPTAAQLVYAFRGGRPASGIALVELLSGGMQRRILARAARRHFFLRPSFAPDGSRLVAQRRGKKGWGSRLWLIGGLQQPRPLTDDPDWFDFKAFFTRDGTQVVFTRRPSEGGRERIAILEIAGGTPRTLAWDPDADYHSARPSPTRDEIAFVVERERGTDVYLTNLAGDEMRNLTRTRRSNEYAPRWSPDGELLVVTTSDTNAEAPKLRDRDTLARARIRVIDREGKRLFETPGVMADWMPAW